MKTKEKIIWIDTENNFLSYSDYYPSFNSSGIEKWFKLYGNNGVYGNGNWSNLDDIFYKEPEKKRNVTIDVKLEII